MLLLAFFVFSSSNIPAPGGVAHGFEESAAPPDPAQPPVTTDGDDSADEEGDDGESEAAAPQSFGPEIRYTRDLSDDELRRRWKDELESLGTISVGFADNGRLINAVQMAQDPAWVLQRPDLAWGTEETVEALATAFRAVHARFPDSAPARLSHIGAKDGGYLRPHRSHQSGRDADIAFFYKNDRPVYGHVHREKLIDPRRNWALIKTLITQTDVQVILVDRGIQRVLRNYALESGEDRQWIDRLFFAGKSSIVQHAKKHRDHFHVRFYSPRSQELGRRIQPLLAQRPEHNLLVHRVKRGQTLGSIARLYGTTVRALQKANRLRGTFLHLDQRVAVPLRKPCTRCPLPPPVVVPPRCLPASATLAAQAPTQAPAAAQ